jgi:hypothetical protein
LATEERSSRLQNVRKVLQTRFSANWSGWLHPVLVCSHRTILISKEQVDFCDEDVSFSWRTINEWLILYSKETRNKHSLIISFWSPTFAYESKSWGKSEYVNLVTDVYLLMVLF